MTSAEVDLLHRLQVNAARKRDAVTTAAGAEIDRLRADVARLNAEVARLTAELNDELAYVAVLRTAQIGEERKPMSAELLAEYKAAIALIERQSRSALNVV